MTVSAQYTTLTSEERHRLSVRWFGGGVPKLASTGWPVPAVAPALFKRRLYIEDTAGDSAQESCSVCQRHLGGLEGFDAYRRNRASVLLTASVDTTRSTSTSHCMLYPCSNPRQQFTLMTIAQSDGTRSIRAHTSTCTCQGHASTSTTVAGWRVITAS